MVGNDAVTAGTTWLFAIGLDIGDLKTNTSPSAKTGGGIIAAQQGLYIAFFTRTDSQTSSPELVERRIVRHKFSRGGDIACITFDEAANSTHIPHSFTVINLWLYFIFQLSLQRILATSPIFFSYPFSRPRMQC